MSGKQLATTCDWCQAEAVSFVAPPAIVEVVAQYELPSKSIDRICGDCFTELLALIVKRRQHTPLTQGDADAAR